MLAIKANVAAQHDGCLHLCCHGDIVSYAAADQDNAFVLLVKALLKTAMGSAPPVQQELITIIAGLYKAVPAWMLMFGSAHNPGCSARAGLDAFKVTLYTT